MTVPEYGVNSEHEWLIHGERSVYDDHRWVKVTKVDVTAPDGERFEHHAIRLHHVASTALINDHNEVLMMWRHRFITQSWVWELPGGIVDPGETPINTAIRETLEETGYLADNLTHIATFQPTPGLIDTPHSVFLSRDFSHITQPHDAVEASVIEWIPLTEIQQLMREEKIGGAGSLVPLLAILAFHHTH